MWAQPTWQAFPDSSLPCISWGRPRLAGDGCLNILCCPAFCLSPCFLSLCGYSYFHLETLFILWDQLKSHCLNQSLPMSFLPMASELLTLLPVELVEPCCREGFNSSYRPDASNSWDYIEYFRSSGFCRAAHPYPFEAEKMHALLS